MFGVTLNDGFVLDFVHALHVEHWTCCHSTCSKHGAVELCFYTICFLLPNLLHSVNQFALLGQARSGVFQRAFYFFLWRRF